MLRKLKIFRRNSGKNPTTDRNKENITVDQTVSSTSQLEADPSRPPFNTIQEPTRNPNSELDQETHFRRKNQKTPSKSHTKGPDQFFQLRTPEKLATGKGRFGWVPKGEQPVLSSPEIREDPFHQGQFLLPPPPPLMASHGLNIGNGYCAATPRSITTGGKASSVHSGTSSTQSTLTKSVTKPMFNGVSNSRAPQYGGCAKAMNILVSSKGIPLSSAPPPAFASAEVPHFDLKEDPSFWMDHNAQLKSHEATLTGAFQREKMADAAKKQLEAEIEQHNRLVRQREEDAQCSKMMIKFREDKIYRMEALLNGLIPSDSYLREEINALSEEIKLLQTKVEINPEVTHFATENIRLLRQLS